MQAVFRKSLCVCACMVALSAHWVLAAPPATSKANEASALAMYDKFAKAFHDKDVNAAMALFAPEEQGVTVYGTDGPLETRGVSMHRKEYEELFSAYEGPINIEFRNLHAVASDEVAFVYALEHVTGSLKDGTKSDMWLRSTTGFRKIGGQWRIVHDHASLPVASYATGKAALDLKPD